MAPSKSDQLYNIVNPQIDDVFRLGKELMNRSRNTLGSIHKGGNEDRRFREFYGVSAITVLATWDRLQEEDLTPAGGKFIHLLWTLLFFKLYGTETDLCAHAGGVYGAIDPKTFRRWTWPMAHALAELEYFVILFENRYIGDQGHDCLLSVDGTDFRIPLVHNDIKAFWTYKFKTCGLRYEVGLSILNGDICWTNGPKPPGLWNDNMIFQNLLAQMLDHNERVEADDGYIGSAPQYVKCPGNIANEEERRELQQRVRNRHETVNSNRRFKQFQILKQVFRHDPTLHHVVFTAIAVLTQISIENGDKLFDIDNYY